MRGQLMETTDAATTDPHNFLYQSALEVLEPIILEDIRRGFPSAETASQEQTIVSVTRGCELLERVIQINPGNWNALWIMGMAQKAVLQWDQAYISFKRAFALEKNNPDVAREFCGACIESGHGPEAVEPARHAVSLCPNDAGLIANLGMALLASGDMESGAIEVNRSLQMNPSDPVTQRLQSAIQQYRVNGR